MSNSVCWMISSASRAPPTGRAVIAFAGEPLAQRIAHHQFVVDDQNSALGFRCCRCFHYALPFVPPVAVPVLRPRHPSRLRPPPLAAAAGSATLNSVPSPGVERTVISPAVLLHDAVRHGQSQAGAVLVLLGGEERIENARQHFRRDAASRCPSPAPRPVRRPPSNSVATSSRPPLGMASEAFTSSTRTTCWIWLASHSTGGRPSARCFRQLDVLHVQLVLHQQHGAVHHGVQIVGLAVAGRLPREGQQVLHQVAAALAFALDGLQLLGHLVARWERRASATRAAPAARRSGCRTAGC